MALAELFGDLIKILFILIPILLLVGGAIVVIWLIFKSKKMSKDEWKEMFREMKADAIINVPPHMKKLYRIHMPFMSDFVDENKGSPDIVEKLEKVLDRHKRRGILLGDIVGFNRIDMLATIEDYLVPTKADDQPLLELTEESKKEIEQLKVEFMKFGRFLNFIVYKPRNQGIFKRGHVEGILCFDDQIVGVNSDDGVVACLGEGSDRLGIFFSILSGYPHRTKVTLTYLQVRSWIRWAMRTQGSVVEVTEKAIRMDADSKKILTFKAVEGMAHAGGGNKDK